MLGRLEECGDGRRLVPPRLEAGAVGAGVGEVPRGAAQLAHQLPQVGAAHPALLPVQAVAGVDGHRLTILLTKTAARASPGPGAHPPGRLLQLQRLDIKSPK